MVFAIKDWVNSACWFTEMVDNCNAIVDVAKLPVAGTVKAGNIGAAVDAGAEARTIVSSGSSLANAPELAVAIKIAAANEPKDLMLIMFLSPVSG